MANTLAQVYERVFKNMGERTTSTTYDILSVVDTINTYIRKVCNGFVVSLLNPNDKYQAGNLKFLEKTVYYNNISPLSISVETVAGDTTLTIDTTTYPTTGKGLINGEIVTWTGKTSTTLTGVNGITTNHAEGSIVSIIYQLPANIYKPFQVFDIYGNEIDYEDFRFSDKTKYYTILTDGSNIDYIYFNSCSYGNVLVRYYKQPSVLVYGDDDSREIDIPGDFGISMIAPLVAGEMKFTQGEEIDLATSNLTAGYASLEEFYGIYSAKAKKKTQTVIIPQEGDRSFYRGNYGRNV